MPRRGDLCGQIRASAAEDARMLIRENEQLLHETGLFRFHQPKAFGGMELDFVAVVDIPAELARGCPSTAWNVGNLACHHWILGYYDPETQREVWDANPDALIASSIALAAGRGRKAEGGFIVNGRWPFSRVCTIRNGTCWPSPSMPMTARRPSTGGCAWCRSPITRSSTRGTPWAWGPRAARTSRSPSGSCPSAARWRCSAAAAGSSTRRRAHSWAALSHPDRGRLQPSPRAGGDRRGRRRLRAVPGGDGQTPGNLHRCKDRGFPGRAGQSGPGALPDRRGALFPAPVRHRVPGQRGAQRGS